MKRFAKIFFLNTAWFVLAASSTLAQVAPDQPSNIYPPNGSTTYADTISMKVTDPQSDIMTVKLYGRIKPTASKFTIVGLPDTQFYTEEPQGLNSGGGGSNAIFKSQTNWIAQHLEDSNIVFVVQLGDCTQNGDDNEIEWMRADTAFRNIENPNIPVPEGIAYGICVGNHDQSPVSDPAGTTTFYNNYFGSARFAGRGYYGGHYGLNNDNHFELFNGGGIDFIHVSLEYNPNSTVAQQTALQNVLNWADSLLKAYSNRKAILSTHWLMGTGNQTSFQGPGQKIYDDLKDNPNLILMLSGHVSGEGRRSDIFNDGIVYTLLSDYQGGYGNGGDGLLRIMQFDPHENSVSVKTFSPWKNNQAGGFLTGPGSQFNLPVRLTPPFTLIGTNTNVNSGDTTVFTWDGIQQGTVYEWYVVINDGNDSTTSNIFEFITAGTLPVNLINLKAVAAQTYVKLNWTVTSQLRSYHFEVERSEDGTSFSKIGAVTAKENYNTAEQYSFNDEHPVNGKSFYRLKIAGNDGNFTYSKLAAITRNRHKFEIIQNPAINSEIRFIYEDEGSKNIKVTVYDMAGNLRISKKLTIHSQPVILRHQLSPGLYNMEVVHDNKKEVLRIAIQ